MAKVEVRKGIVVDKRTGEVTKYQNGRAKKQIVLVKTSPAERSKKGYFRRASPKEAIRATIQDSAVTVSQQTQKNLETARRASEQMDQLRRRAEQDARRRKEFERMLRTRILTGISSDPFIANKLLEKSRKELDEEIKRLKTSPVKPEVIKELEKQRRLLTLKGVAEEEKKRRKEQRILSAAITLAEKKKQEKKFGFSAVKIGSNYHFPQSRNEKAYLQMVSGIVARDEKFKRNYENALKRAGVNIRENDRWFTKLEKGLVGAGISLIYQPYAIAIMVDKVFTPNALKLPQAVAVPNLNKKVSDSIKLAQKIGFLKEGYASKSEKARAEAAVIAAKQVPAEFWRSIDPAKPENWANDLLLLLSMAEAGIRAARATTTKLKRNYVPSTRKAAEMKKTFLQKKQQVKVAKKLAKNAIDDGVDVARYKKLLKQLDKLDDSIDKSLNSINKAIKDPGVLKLIDYNPIVESSKLLKNVGKDVEVFHATGVSPKKLFGQKYKKIKPSKDILQEVSKTSSKPRRPVQAKTPVEKVLLEAVSKEGAIVSGGKALNAYVKKILTRKTIDYDILSRNPKELATKTINTLRRRFPEEKFTLLKYKVKSGPTVWRLQKGGNVIADFDPLPKGLKTNTIKGVKIPRAKFLAENKLAALTDLRKQYRWKKDLSDLKRLTGKLFDDSKVKTKVNDPKNYFQVREIPQGMGADRIKFGETQMFFDLEVPTSYAYNSILRNVFPKWVRNLAKSLKQPILEEIANLRYVKVTDKFTILKTKVRISNFPKDIQKRISLARKGLLSGKKAVKLRKDINSYINKEPGKVFIGSRTGSFPIGEREVVSPVGTYIGKLKRRFTVDPETGLLADVIDVAIKQHPEKIKPSVFRDLKGFLKFSVDDLKRRFTPGDMSKVVKYKRIINRVDKLTAQQADDVLRLAKKLKGAKKRKFISQAERLKRNSLLKNVKNLPSKKKLAFTVREKPKITRKVAAARVSTRAKLRTPIKRRVVPRKVRRVVKRPVKRVPVRTKTRPVKRVTKRPILRPRVTLRTRVRITPRIARRVLSRPRIRISPRSRIRADVRTIKSYVNKIPSRFKYKAPKNAKEKKALAKWYKKQRVQYKPSLAAVIYGITSYKLPKKVTGFEVRPLIVEVPK